MNEAPNRRARRAWLVVGLLLALGLIAVRVHLRRKLLEENLRPAEPASADEPAGSESLNAAPAPDSDR